jgi:hypothetical protein
MSAAPTFGSATQPPLFTSLLDSLSSAQSAARDAAKAVERRGLTLDQHRFELQRVEEETAAAMQAFGAITQMPPVRGEPHADSEGQDATEQALAERARITTSRGVLQGLAASIPRFVELARWLEVTTDHPDYSAWQQAAAQALPLIIEALASGDIAALNAARDELQTWLDRRASVVSTVERQYSAAKSAAENQILLVGRAEVAVASRMSDVNQARDSAYSLSFGAAAKGAGLACLPGSCYGAVATGQTALGSGLFAAVGVGVVVFMISLLMKTNSGDAEKAEQGFRSADGQLAEARRTRQEAQQKLDKLEEQRKAILG